MAEQQMVPPIGASVWERDLYEHLTTHVERERVILKEYLDAADAAHSKAFSYLVHLLVDDERRHHQMFMSLASSLKTDAELSGEDPVVPHMDFDAADRARLLALTRRLLDAELDDAKELKRLHHVLDDVKDTTLWDLLVGLMRRDTDKHIAILEFILRHTES